MNTVPENPDVVQHAMFSRPGALPVFLIHDGGGTTFAYHCLGELKRPVYGIWNPRFYSGNPWDDGLDEMARTYVDMVRKTVSSPSFPTKPSRIGQKVKLLLGGWSLGGLLSIEVAHLLVDDPEIEVAGLLMVDSIYPVRPGDLPRPVASQLVEPPDGSTDPQKLAHQCLRQARGMLEKYRLPRTWEESASSTRLPPHAILIRAKGYVPTFIDAISPVDTYREDEKLGWGNYHSKFICDVLEVDAHHFDIFSWEHIDEATEKIKAACDFLDRIAD
jgi:thioesterase domain-containing protein